MNTGKYHFAEIAICNLENREDTNKVHEKTDAFLQNQTET